jgi:hypothetical protein
VNAGIRMSSPFKRFFGGIMIGIFLSIPIILSRSELFGSRVSEEMTAIPLLSSEAFTASYLVFLGFTCAWVGAMATRKARPAHVSLSIVKTLQLRRQRRQRYHFLR